MADLPDYGVTSYGEYTFPSNVETTSLSVVPQYDQAGRTVVYNRIRIAVRAVLTGTAIDAAVRAVTQVLTKPAQPLRYTGRGYGLLVNVGTVKDVRWGPTPTEATVRPLGGGNAAELTWAVEVHIPDGPSAYYTHAPMEFNFSLSYDIDASGYTTRTYAAFVRIPLTRAFPADRAIRDTADRLRESIVPPLLPGFRRIPGTVTISDDKTRADVVVTDTQMPPNVPPQGVIEASASHTVHSVPGQIVRWTGTLEATYEIARNGATTVAAARDAFFALAKDRINHTIDTISAGQTTELRTNGGGAAAEAVVIPVSFSMSEPELYGRTKARFSLTYVVNNANLRAMLGASGLWRPVPGSNWQRWAAGLGPVLGARGHAGLVFSPNDDKIIDLLRPSDPRPGLLSRLNEVGRHLADPPQSLFPDPKPERSWLEYVCAVYVETDNGVVEVRTLPTQARTAAGDVYGRPTAAGAAISSAVGGAFAAIPGVLGKALENPFYGPMRETFLGGAGKDALAPQAPQRRARQGAALWLIGHAVRVLYAIPAPTAERWGDAVLTPANRPDRGEGFWTGVVGNAIWPITAARWRLRYLMDRPPPAGAPVVPNPFRGGGGADAANVVPDVGNILKHATDLGFAIGGGLPGGG